MRNERVLENSCKTIFFSDNTKGVRSYEACELKSRSMSSAALPRWRVTDKCWKKCLISVASSLPQRLALWRAIFFRVFTASLSQPPKVSTTRGWKSIPSRLQASKWSRILEDLRFSMADAGVSAALSTSLFCVGEVTLTSKATRS